MRTRLIVIAMALALTAGSLTATALAKHGADDGVSPTTPAGTTPTTTTGEVHHHRGHRGRCQEHRRHHGQRGHHGRRHAEPGDDRGNHREPEPGDDRSGEDGGSGRG